MTKVKLPGMWRRTFSSEHEHGIGLAAALGVPEDAEPAVVLAQPANLSEGVVDADDLVVLADQLDEGALAFVEEGEVLDQIEEAGGGAGATDDGFEGDGAGLGLAIAQGLIQAQGGRIWAESRPGGGTRVAFVLPLAA